jgi:hypothetical protein
MALQCNNHKYNAYCSAVVAEDMRIVFSRKVSSHKEVCMSMARIQSHIKNGLTFSRVGIDAAVRQMLSRQIYVSRVAKDGIAIGFTHSALVDHCLVSAYADGFWIAPLTIHLNGSGRLDSVKIAPTLLSTMNMEFAEMGRHLAARQSAVHLDDRAWKESGIEIEIEALRKRMTDAGVNPN